MLCSIEVTAESMAVVAATLANGGVCPLTGDRVFNARTVRNTLSLMASCGMYDYSGEFAFLMGFPCKSGVGGSLCIVIPGVTGICTWSPSLDRIGNSVRGQDFCKQLVQKYAIHMLDARSGYLSLKPRIDAASLLKGAVGTIIDKLTKFKAEAGNAPVEPDPKTQIHVRGIGVSGWDGTANGVGTFENEAALGAIFSKFGKFLSARIRHRVDMEGGQNTSWALVTMVSIECVDKAMNAVSVMAGNSKLELTRFCKKQADSSSGAMSAVRASASLVIDQHDYTILWNAAARGQEVRVRHMIGRGLCVDLGDYDGRTALHLAASGGHLSVVNYLLNRLSANPDVKDRFGYTPLADAQREGHADCAQRLRVAMRLDDGDAVDDHECPEKFRRSQSDEVLTDITANGISNAILHSAFRNLDASPQSANVDAPRLSVPCGNPAFLVYTHAPPCKTLTV